MMLLNISHSAQVTALIIQSLGALLLMFVAWMARRVWRAVEKIYERLDHLDTCIDKVKTSVEEVQGEQQEVRRELQTRNVEHSDLREQLAHLKGVSGLALHEDIKT